MEPEALETGIYTRNTLIGFFLVTLVVTTGLTAYYAPPDWSWLRIGGAGLVGAGLCYLMVFVNHMIAPPREA